MISNKGNGRLTNAPIDVNFYIAVRRPVPTMIYTHSTELLVAYKHAGNSVCHLYVLCFLMAFPEAAGRVLMSSTVFDTSFNFGTGFGPRSNVSKSQLKLYNDTLKTRYPLSVIFPLCCFLP
jgi:hypothetical protein